jgi:hypothetical protein
MATPVFQVRVDEGFHDLLVRVVRSLKSDPLFSARLEGLLGGGVPDDPKPVEKAMVPDKAERLGALAASTGSSYRGEIPVVAKVLPAPAVFDPEEDDSTVLRDRPLERVVRAPVTVSATRLDKGWDETRCTLKGVKKK